MTADRAARGLLFQCVRLWHSVALVFIVRVLGHVERDRDHQVAAYGEADAGHLPRVERVGEEGGHRPKQIGSCAGLFASRLDWLSARLT